MFELKNVCKKYENGYVAISDISLQIGKVGLVAITGESGAGKTTLLNLLAKNDNITSGSIKFCKKELSECTESEIAQQFAFIFQDYKLIENMTVLENLSIAVELAGLPVDMPKIDNYLQKYKLQEHKNNKISTLSGGQKQRISIIRALLRQPKVIFADEPTGNLDTQNTETIFEELKEIAKTQLVILVSHDKESVNKFADRVINLIDGKIATDSANNHSQILAETTETAAENTAETIEKTAENTAEEIAKTTEKTAENAMENIAKTIETTAENTAENKRGKGRLQAKTAVKTAFSFYKIKSLTNVVNVIMIILTAIIMFVGLNISMTSYEDVVYQSTKNLDNKPMIISFKNQNKTEVEPPEMQVFTPDLSVLSDKLTKEGAKNAKVYSMPSTFSIPSTFDMYDKNGKEINIIDDYFINKQDYSAVLTDDLSGLNVDILSGRQAQTAYECVVPKSLMNALLLNIFVDENGGKLLFSSEEQVFNYSFGKCKIVGAFDDKLQLEEKFKNVSIFSADIVNSSEENSSDGSNNGAFACSNNLLSSLIFMSEKNVEEFTKYAFINADYSDDSYNKFAVICNNYFSKATSLCLPIIPLQINLSLAEGDIIAGNIFNNYFDSNNIPLQIGSNLNLEVIHFLNGFIDTTNEFAFNVKSKTSGATQISAEDFNKMFGGYVLPQNGIFTNSNFSHNDINKISSFANSIFGKQTKNFGITFDTTNMYGYRSERDNFNDIKLKIVLPITVVMVVVLLFLLIIYVINIVKNKAKNIVILRSLGCSNKEYFKVFGLILVFLNILFLGFAICFGCIFLANLQNYLINSELMNVGFYNLFAIDVFAVLLSIALLLITSVVALMVVIKKINSKNIRMSFQQGKD